MRRRQLQALLCRLRFPVGLWSSEGTGLVARYDSWNRLTHLHWEEAGTPYGWRLVLDPPRAHGRLTISRSAGGTSDSMVYASGCWERFDAWSDNTRPSPMSWRRWVRWQVRDIVDRVGCSLCAGCLTKTPPEAFGPADQHFLCGPCFQSTLEQDPVPRQWPLGTRACQVCGESFGDDALMFEDRRGKICRPCAQRFRPR